MDVSIIIPRCARDLIVKFRLHDKIKLKKKERGKKGRFSSTLIA